MGYLTVVANGQSLTVDIQTPGAHEALVYTTAALSSQITLPDAITADKDYYFKAGSNVVTVTATTAAGVQILNQQVEVHDTDHLVLTPLPTAAQAAATDARSTLRVSNSAAGTTLGTVVKKLEVFDTTGASLGFLPIYDGIT